MAQSQRVPDTVVQNIEKAVNVGKDITVDQRGSTRLIYDCSRLGSQVKQTPPQNIRVKNKENFVGRDEKLQSLHQSLQQHQRVAISSTLTSIVGMGGIGKTELAGQYALRCWRAVYPGGICWLQARQGDLATQIINDYGRIKLKLNPDESLTEEQPSCLLLGKLDFPWRRLSHFR